MSDPAGHFRYHTQNATDLKAAVIGFLKAQKRSRTTDEIVAGLHEDAQGTMNIEIILRRLEEEGVVKRSLRNGEKTYRLIL
ncbi:MAG TPA: hypothetical protein VJW20_14450 [Candidatus Angelobacter sp.]|nr:hypothetical protein [Candidatus Angelobacter sp.]